MPDTSFDDSSTMAAQGPPLPIRFTDVEAATCRHAF